ncbi:LysE family translocator [Roseibium sp. HPY-6]|uniref:LysE family translocator n=1 Tax=Roseibium sp. HPY-6 TaxID=3229852 RepID=UPI00338E30EE
MTVDGFIAVVIAFFIVTVSPGPANIAVATVSMSQGRKRGLLFGFGLSCGLAFWGLVAATGLGAVLQASEYALMAIKLLGGGYLLWLAFQSARTAARPATKPHSMNGSGNWFLRGLILNLSNPKAVVAWMAALSMGLGNGEGAMHLVIITLVCMVLGVINYTGHAVVFSNTKIMKAYEKARRLVEGVVSGLFALAGLGLLKSALSR